jgi:hypothetical protein
MRDIICLVLVSMLFGTTTLEARVGAAGAVPGGQTGSGRKPTIKERILEIPPGTMIEVRLLNKQKIRGRLGEITDEGFSLQTAQGDKIDTQKFAFGDLKSVKKVEANKGAATAGYVVLGALAGVGALVLILIAVAASGD